MILEPQTPRFSSGAPPYRAPCLRPAPWDRAQEEQFNADIAFTFAFVWATALLRFVIVCKRHEVMTSDPIFAAMLTFGIPAVVIACGAVAMWRCVVRGLLLLRSLPDSR